MLLTGPSTCCSRMEPIVLAPLFPSSARREPLTPGSGIPSGPSGAPASRTGSGCGGRSFSGLWLPACPARPSPLGSLASWAGQRRERVTCCRSSNDNHSSVQPGLCQAPHSVLHVEQLTESSRTSVTWVLLSVPSRGKAEAGGGGVPLAGGDLAGKGGART